MTSNDTKILDAVERAEGEIVKTLSDLIAFPSIVPTDPEKAGPAERECQEYLRDRLRRARLQDRPLGPRRPGALREISRPPRRQCRPHLRGPPHPRRHPRRHRRRPLDDAHRAHRRGAAGTAQPLADPALRRYRRRRAHRRARRRRHEGRRRQHADGGVGGSAGGHETRRRHRLHHRGRRGDRRHGHARHGRSRLPRRCRPAHRGDGARLLADLPRHPVGAHHHRRHRRSRRAPAEELGTMAARSMRCG